MIPRTLTIGGLEKPSLLSRLRALGIQLNRAAEVLFEDDRFTVLPEERQIQIASRSVADLGFDGGATYDEVIARAGELGWTECPLELGAHLRLQYLDQPELSAQATTTKGTAPPGSITVASTPLDDGDDTPRGFYLRRFEGQLWLRGYGSWPGHAWKPEDTFLFCAARPGLKP